MNKKKDRAAREKQKLINEKILYEIQEAHKEELLSDE